MSYALLALASIIACGLAVALARPAGRSLIKARDLDVATTALIWLSAGGFGLFGAVLALGAAGDSPEISVMVFALAIITAEIIAIGATEQMLRAQERENHPPDFSQTRRDVEARLRDPSVPLLERCFLRVQRALLKLIGA